jgi:hypothetical protein
MKIARFRSPRAEVDIDRRRRESGYGSAAFCTVGFAEPRPRYLRVRRARVRSLGLGRLCLHVARYAVGVVLTLARKCVLSAVALPKPQR